MLCLHGWGIRVGVGIDCIFPNWSLISCLSVYVVQMIKRLYSLCISVKSIQLVDIVNGRSLKSSSPLGLATTSMSWQYCKPITIYLFLPQWDSGLLVWQSCEVENNILSHCHKALSVSCIVLPVIAENFGNLMTLTDKLFACSLATSSFV